MVLAEKNVLRRLVSWTRSDQINLSGISSIRDAVYFLNLKKFDLILIDSSFKEAPFACEIIFETMAIPIALMIKNRHINWKRYLNWKVDGFINENTREDELIARIKSFTHRNTRYLETSFYLAN